MFRKANNIVENGVQLRIHHGKNLNECKPMSEKIGRQFSTERDDYKQE